MTKKLKEKYWFILPTWLATITITLIINSRLLYAIELFLLFITLVMAMEVSK
jgi:hypothetical protein